MHLNISRPAGNAGLINVFDGLLDPKICTSIVNRLTTVWDKSTPGKTLGGVDTRTKSTNDLHFSRVAFDNYGLTWDSEWYEYEMHIANGLISAVSAYKQQYRHLDTWVDITDTGFQVQRYYKNWGFYRPHVDSFPNSSVNDRVLGAVVYLNDVEVGGETNFPLHEVSVEAKVGRISLFPACWTHPHESCVPLSGDKWIISTFILNSTSEDDAQEQPADDEQQHDHHDGDHHHHDEEVANKTVILSNESELAQREHYHVCVKCANNEAHECTFS